MHDHMIQLALPMLMGKGAADPSAEITGRPDQSQAPTFTDLLACFLLDTPPVEMQKGVAESVQSRMEGPSPQSLDSVFRIPDLSQPSAGSIPEHSEQASAPAVRVVPLEMIAGHVECDGAMEADSKALLLPASLEAELHIMSVSDTQAIDYDIAHARPESDGKRSMAILKLTANQACVAVPVEVVESAVSVLGMPVHGQPSNTLELTLVDDTRLPAHGSRLILSGHDGDSMDLSEPHERVFQVVSRPEVITRHVVIVADPAEFLRRIMPELEFSARDQAGTAEWAGKDPTLKVRALCSDDPAQGHDQDDGDSREEVSPGRQSAAKRLVEESGARLGKVDIQRLSRNTEGVAELLHKFSGEQAGENPEMELLEASFKPGAARMVEGQSMHQFRDSQQNVIPHNAKFTVHLPDSGSKITEVSSFRVTLQPESLGNVKVHLVMVDNHLTARLTVESPMAKQAVEANMPVLKETLEQHGIKVEHFSVNVAQDRDPRARQDWRRNARLGESGDESLSIDAEEPRPGILRTAEAVSGTGSAGYINLLV